MTPKLTPLQEREILKELHRREAVLNQRKVASRPSEAELAKATELTRCWTEEEVWQFRETHAGAEPDGMFTQSRAFFFDAEYEASLTRRGRRINRMRVGRCTRRAAKTSGAARKILATLLRNPRAVVLYLAKALPVVKEQIWPELQRLVAEHNLPFEFNETNMRMKHTRSTGRAIFRGADNVGQLNKLRGLGVGGTFVLAIIDEGGTFGAEMERMVAACIGPGLRDCGGELLMVGTPGDFPEGLFYEASEGLRKNWVRARWTLQDNVFLKPEAKDEDLICEEEGLTKEDPIFVKEWRGEYCINDRTQMWVYDPAQHSFRGHPPIEDGPYEYWGGVDFGWVDATAITILAWSRKHRRMYAVESWGASFKDSDAVAEQLQRLGKAYGVTRWVGDTGTHGGRVTADSIFRDYGIYIERAEKQEKLNYVSFMNAAFRSGRLRVNYDDELSRELPKVLWNPQKTDSHNKAQDNRSHALLYVWRAAEDQAGKQKPGAPLLSSLPGMQDWPEEELRAKVGNTVQPYSADTPWYLRSF